MTFLCTMLAAAALDAPLFYNIAPYSPGREKTVAADMREYAERTGCRKVLYSLTLHPEGKCAMEKVDKAVASYRALKKELEGSDVELGILLQAILGHWPRTDREVEPWQRTVDQRGREVRFCWLDPRFRDYIRTVGQKLAAEKPSFILGDDDIRAFSPAAECFCPLHTAEFNRRCGTSYTSAEMREAVASSKPGDKTFETFMALQREYVNGVAKLVREGINSVDPSIPAGTCMPSWEKRFNHQAAQAIAARGQPTVMRIANGNYHDWRFGSTEFNGIVQKTQAMYAFHKDEVDMILSEADTYPHHLWSRSSTSWHAHLTMTLFTGLKGAKLWYVNAHKGSSEVHRNYTDIMAANKGFYPALTAAMKGSEPLGLIEPCLVNFPSWHPSSGGREDFVAAGTWATKFLGRVGVPYTCSRDYARDGIWTLAGSESVARLTDADLRSILSRRVVVDGTAAVELTKRGFAGLTGVEARMDDSLMFNRERDVESGKTLRLFRSDCVPLITMRPGAKELAYLAYAPYSGAPESERVASGTVFFENRLGGKVVSSAWHLGVSIDQIAYEGRQDWMSKIIDVLGGGVPRCMNRQDMSMLAAKAADGATMMAVFNLNYDPVDTIELKLDGKVVSVEVLCGDGTWERKEFSSGNGLVKVPCRLSCYRCAVLRVRTDTPKCAFPAADGKENSR